MTLMDSTPASNRLSRSEKPTSLYVQHNDQMVMHESYDYNMHSSPSAMSIDENSPLPGRSFQGTPSHHAASPFSYNTTARELKSPSTPSSLSSNGTTVTFIGFPYSKQTFVLDLAANQCGPIYHINKPEKQDSNWLIVTFLNPASADKALLLDGRAFESSWVLCVKRGDTIGVISPGKKQRTGLPSTEPDSRGRQGHASMTVVPTPGIPPKDSLHHRFPSVESPLVSAQMRQKRSLLLDESSLMNYSIKSPATPIKENILPQSASPSQLYPEIPAESSFPVFVQPSTPLPSHPMTNLTNRTDRVNEQDNQSVVKPAGFLTKIADLLFGW